MAPVTLSDEGQITIPQTILDRLGAAAGDKLDLWFDRGYLIIRKAGGVAGPRGNSKRSGPSSSDSKGY
jgi:AbrB family looped-hinge helix DNA binding protein